jgi:DNA helicase-2/ATP-dependent DNA helicase PcrA
MANKTGFKMLPMKDELMKGLNDSQLEAVLAVDGAIQICAVAGSGKTHVLTRRVAYMINVLKIAPETIALMTFTKKAADEMKKRLEMLISKKDLEAMFCGTSHSFGYRVLAREYKAMNHPLKDFALPERMKDSKNKGVLMGNDQIWFAEEVKQKLLKSPFIEADVKKVLKDTQNKVLLAIIGNAKNNDIDQWEYEKLNAMDATPAMWAYINFYKEYESMKYARLAIDGDDMLFLTVRLFRQHPEILAKYQKQIEYIMIDETQDNNAVQYELAQMLIYPQENIFVVGDDDQSMYRFRMAMPEFFVEFFKIFPNVRQIGLEHNYRSHPEILTVANKLIAHNEFRIKKQLVPHKTGDDKAVFYSHHVSEVEEAKAAVEEIKTLKQIKGLEYKDMFVLYRTNAQNKEFEDALIANEIPYVIHGGKSFYDRAIVKDIMGYFRLVNDTNDDEAFARVYNTPSRYVGKAYLAKLQAVKGYSMWDAINKVNLTPSEKTASNSLKNVVNGMKQLLEEGKTADELIRFLMENGYAEHIKKGNDVEEEREEEEEERENPVVTKMCHFASRFKSLDSLIKYVDMMQKKRRSSVNGVQMMTIHRSKGLEAKAVFGIGVNENLLPHYKAVEEYVCENGAPMEEERRLAYVLVTRAEELLFLSSTSTFNGKDCGASRFIAEMELQPQVDEDKNTEEEAEEEAV